MNQVNDFLTEIQWHLAPTNFKLFAIVDCAQIETDSVWRSLHSFNEQVRKSLFEGTPDAGLSNVEPVLLDVLNPLVPNLMAWLLAREIDRPMVLWLASSLPLASLQDHLKTVLTVNLPGAPDSVLRFYDPRVFKKLMAVTTPEQKAIFFTHAAAWWAWDNIAMKRSTFGRPSPVAAAPNLVFSQAQMTQFSQLDIADFAQQVWADLWKDRAEFAHLRVLSPADSRQQIDLHIAKASAYGLETEDGVRAYLLCVANALGWSFEENQSHGLALATLKTPSLTEEEKLERLQAYCDKHMNTKA